MAEIVGGVTSGIAVAQAAQAVGGAILSLSRLWSEVKDVPDTIRNTVKELELSGKLVTAIESELCLRGSNASMHDEDSLAAIQSRAIHHCHQIHQELDGLVNNLSADIASTRRRKSLLAKTKVVLKKDTLKKYKKRLRRALRLLDSTVQLHLASSIKQQSELVSARIITVLTSRGVLPSAQEKSATSLSVLPRLAGDDDDDEGDFDTEESNSVLRSGSEELHAGAAESAGVSGAPNGKAFTGTGKAKLAYRPASTPAFTLQTAATAASGTASDQEMGIDLDSIIDRLLEVRGSRPGKLVNLLDVEMRYLCTKAKEIFLSQPTLLELVAPLSIIGDLHGQYYDLLRLLEWGGFPPESNYLFLGNYVSVGKQSIETMCLILAYKIKYPENFFPLRGNHECVSVSRRSGFYDECKRRYNIKLWNTFTDMFNCMPVAAIIDDKIFCVHGGLSPDLCSMEQIRSITRPIDVPKCGLLYDLLWNDPDMGIKGWAKNRRASEVDPAFWYQSFTFGPDVVSRFLQKHGMDLIVRGNQVVDGYELFARRQLVTIWGAVGYMDIHTNGASILCIDEALMCSFKVLERAPPKVNSNSNKTTVA